MTTREYHNQYIGAWPRDIRYSFSDRVGQSAVQLDRRYQFQDPAHRSLCALAVEKAMQRYPELMRADLEEFEKHGTVMEGVIKLPPQPPPPLPPPTPDAPGDWVGEGGRKRKSRKRKSKKRKSRKRKSRKRKSRK